MPPLEFRRRLAAGLTAAARRLAPDDAAAAAPDPDPSPAAPEVVAGLTLTGAPEHWAARVRAAGAVPFTGPTPTQEPAGPAGPARPAGPADPTPQATTGRPEPSPPRHRAGPHGAASAAPAAGPVATDGDFTPALESSAGGRGRGSTRRSGSTGSGEPARAMRAADPTVESASAAGQSRHTRQPRPAWASRQPDSPAPPTGSAARPPVDADPPRSPRPPGGTMPSDPVEAGNPVERPAPDRLVLGHQGARMHRQDTQPVAGASDPSAPEPMTGPTESPDSPAAPGRRSDRQPLVTHRPSDLQRHDHGAIGHPDEAAGARLDPTRPRLMPMPQARDGRPTPGPPPAGQAHDLQFGHPQVPALPTGQLEPDGDQRWPDLPRRLTGIPPVMPLGPMAIRDISRAARLAAEQAAI